MTNAHYHRGDATLMSVRGIEHRFWGVHPWAADGVNVEEVVGRVREAVQAVSVSESISRFCLDNSVAEKKARYAGLLAEEAVEHIRRFNQGKKPPRIDLFCKVLPDKLILTVRDNGALFDPANTDEDTEEFSNLKMINSVAENVEYSRVIGLNNMLVELGR